MNKKLLTLVSLVLALMMVVSACGGAAPAPAASSEAAPAASSEAAPAESAAAPVEKSTVKFYGMIVEYAPVEGMIKRMQEKLADKYDFEVIPVDWGNLESVISTGIASGDPCDVYTYWPQNMDTFVKTGQALDLTPYLEANGGEWKNTFVQAQLDTGNLGGKYWAVPLDGTYQMAMVNKKIFEDAGVTINPTWTWDEFIAASEKIKATGKHPFALWRDGVDWLWKNSLMSAYNASGQTDAFLNFDIKKDDPQLSALLDRAKLLSDSGYWYPGVGGVNSARDEARASFVKGDTAVLFEMASLYAGIAAECEFDVVPVCWPSAGKTVNVGGTDGFFIPSNAKNPDGAVEALKVLLDAESQAMLPEASIIPSNASVKITDPALQSLVDLSQYMWSKTPANQEFQDFMKQQFVPSYVLGTASKEDLLSEYEAICAAAKAAQ